MMDLGDPEERARANAEAVRLASDLDEPVEGWRGSLRLCFDHVERGAFDEARVALEAAHDLAERLDLPHYRWPVRAAMAMLALHRGDRTEAERLRGEAQAFAERAGDGGAQRPLLLQEMQQRRFEGRADQARAMLPRVRAAMAPLRFGEFLVPLLDGALGAATDDGPSDARMLRACDRSIDLRDLSLLELVVEIPAATSDRERAARIAQTLVPRGRRFASWGQLGMTVGPPGAYLLGRLAMAGGRYAEAVEQLRDAGETVRRTGPSILEPMIAAALAEACDAAGDASGAAEARARLRDAARRLGMDGWGADRTLPIERPAPAAPPREEPVALRRDGEGWALHARGRVLRMRDTRGVQLLARLVAEPGRSFHVLDLVSPTGRAADVDAGDAGEAIDAQARDAYRARVRGLREELAEADEWNDTGRAERIRAELEAIEAELARALGLGGRPRRDKGAAERARVNVQRRLRDALDRIAKQDPELASEMRDRLNTGMSCVFHAR